MKISLLLQLWLHPAVVWPRDKTHDEDGFNVLCKNGAGGTVQFLQTPPYLWWPTYTPSLQQDFCIKSTGGEEVSHFDLWS